MDNSITSIFVVIKAPFSQPKKKYIIQALPKKIMQTYICIKDSENSIAQAWCTWPEILITSAGYIILFFFYFSNAFQFHLPTKKKRLWKKNMKCKFHQIFIVLFLSTKDCKELISTCPANDFWIWPRWWDFFFVCSFVNMGVIYSYSVDSIFYWCFLSSYGFSFVCLPRGDQENLFHFFVPQNPLKFHRNPLKTHQENKTIIKHLHTCHT